MARALCADFYENRYERVLTRLKKSPWLVHAYDPEEQQTPLHLAAASRLVATTSRAKTGNLRVIRWLIEHGADVNARCCSEFTPLHLAESPAVARLLLQSGANPNLHSAWGQTPLQMAAQTKKIAVARAIQSQGVPLDLQSALWMGERDIAKRLIARYPETVKHPAHQADLCGDVTPLGIAAGQGDTEIVRLLLQAGAPVNSGTTVEGGYTATPLIMAVGAGKAEIVEILCRAGANTNVTIIIGPIYDRQGNLNNRTLLDYARQHSSKRIQDILLKYGARASHRENKA